MAIFKLAKATCKRCGWQWTPRKKDVRKCPKCNSALWDVKPEAKRDDDGNR